MLRITIEEKECLTKFRLEGKLKGEWVRELERCWIFARNADAGRRFSLDLSNVNFVDESGKVLLSQIASQGATLEASGPMMGALVKEIAGRVPVQSCEAHVG